MFNTNSGYSLSDIAAATGNDRNNGMWGGDGAWWIIILFLFCFAGWGGGWGGNNGSSGAGYQGNLTRDELTYGFDLSDIRSGIRGITSDVASGTYGLNSSLMAGFSGVNETVNNSARNIQSDICNMGMTNLQNTNTITNAITSAHYQTNNQLMAMAAQQAQCCCDSERLIQSSFADLNYNLASQACENRRATQDAARDIIDNTNASMRSILDFLVQDKLDTLNAENAALRGQISQSEQNAYLVSQLAQRAPIPAYVVQNPYASYGGCGYPYVNTCGCNG